MVSGASIRSRSVARTPASLSALIRPSHEKAWRAMKRWIAAQHLVDAVLDVVKVGAVLNKDETIGRLAIIG